MTGNDARAYRWMRAAALLGILVAACRPGAAQDPQQGWIAKQFQRFRTYPHLDRAYKLIRENRHEEARAELERYLSLAPADREARVNYLLVLYRLKRYGPAIGEASRLLQDKPEARIYLHRALAREELRDMAEALEDYRRAAQSPEAEPGDKAFALRQAADLALALKKPDIALQALDTLGPSSSAYHYHLARGMALDMANQPEAARKAFSHAALAGTSAEEVAGAFEFEAELCKRSGDWNAAREALENALRVRPDAVAVLRSLADVNYQEKRYDDTVRDLRHALALQERAADRELLVRALKASGHVAEAEKGLEPLLRSTKPDTRLLVLKSELAIEQNNADSATRSLTQALRQEPANIPALRLMAGIAARQTGKPKESIRWMERIPIPQRNTADVEFLAGLYLDEGPPSSAVWLYKKLLRTADRDDLRYGYFVQLGKACTKAGRLEDARKALTEATRIQSGFAAVEPLVDVLLKGGNNRQALAELDRATLRPLSPEQRARAGMLYSIAGSPEKAVHQLGLALQGGLPHEAAVQARAQRAFAYRGLGRLHEALEDFNAAAGLDPGNASLWTGLGETCIALGDFSAAKDALARARALRDDPPARLLQAQALEGAGDWVQALEIYEEVLPKIESDRARAVTCLTAIASLETRLGRHAGAAAHALRAYETAQTDDWTLLAQALQSEIAAEDWSAADALAGRLAALPIPRDVAGENWERRGEIALKVRSAEAAAEFFAKAIAAGRDGWEIHQKLGLVLYDLGRKRHALDSFASSLQRREAALTLVYAGRCASALGHSDLALDYFGRALANSAALSETQQCDVRREAGYLYFAATDYSAAAMTWELAGRCGPDPLLAVKTAKAWRLAGQWASAQKALPAPPGAGNAPGLQAEYLDEVAAQLEERGQRREAMAALAQAAELEPQAERHYLLGRWHRESGKPKEALLHLRAAVKLANANAEYHSALGYALLAERNYAEAAVQFEEALRLQPDNVALRKDLGYAYVRLARNKDAVRSFRQALATESREVPARSDDGGRTARDDTGRLRQEIERLENAWDVTTFVAQSSDKRELPPTPPVLGLGVIPSYAGTEIAFTPAKIGLRNERIFQVFARVLANLQPGTLKPDPESYTAGLGARYKPLRTQNLFVSGERIFGLRNGAASNWLLRSLYSKDWGYDLKAGQRRWNYSLLYGDLGLYLRGPRLLIGYGEFRQGISFNVRDTLVITPHVVADGRFYRLNTTADPYVEGGGGVSFKFFLRHGEYELRRASFELLLHYRAGRVLNPEKDNFNGLAAGAILGF